MRRILPARAATLTSVPALATVLATVLAAAPAARAQMLGLPVVQTPFGGRAFALALDAGGGGNGIGTAGLAVAARNGGSRIVGTLGIGALRGFANTRPSFGGRVAYLFPFGASGSFAVAPFVGAGAVSAGDQAKQQRSTSGRPVLGGSVTIIPAGVGVGYRRAVAGHAVAVHLTPHVQYWRAGVPDADATHGTYVRVGVGLDAALTRQLGLAVAAEGGRASDVVGTGSAATGLAQGPRTTLFGVALSYTPRRARR